MKFRDQRIPTAAEFAEAAKANHLGAILIYSRHVAVVDRVVAQWKQQPVLLRQLRDVLPQREWTTDDLVEDVIG